MKQLMQSLKLAQEDDISLSLELIEELFQDSIYSKVSKFKKNDVTEVLLRILRGKPEDGIILLYDRCGILVASRIQHLFNKEENTAIELAFWARDKKAVKPLLKAYKYWAKRVGCTSIMYGKMKHKNEVEEYIIRKLT